MNITGWSVSDIDKWVQEEQAVLKKMNEEIYQRTYDMWQVFRELERRLVRPK